MSTELQMVAEMLAIEMSEREEERLTHADELAKERAKWDKINKLEQSIADLEKAIKHLAEGADRMSQAIATPAPEDKVEKQTLDRIEKAIPMALHFGCSSIVMMCFDSITHGDLSTLNPLDAQTYSIDYQVGDIGADVQEMRRNLEWVRPHVLKSLEYIPHSWFTPRDMETR